MWSESIYTCSLVKRIPNFRNCSSLNEIYLKKKFLPLSFSSYHYNCFHRRDAEEYQLPDRERQPGEVREKHYKPTFKVIPSDLEVKEGKLARFNCRVTGRPPPDLVWYRNEMPVYPDANHRVSPLSILSSYFYVLHIYTCSTFPEQYTD